MLQRIGINKRSPICEKYNYRTLYYTALYNIIRIVHIHPTRKDMPFPETRSALECQFRVPTDIMFKTLKLIVYTEFNTVKR